MTIWYSYPVPRIDECIDSLGVTTIFSTLDGNSKYWQVEIAEEDRHKIGFTSREDVFRFTRMPLRFKNVPRTLQRVMDVMLTEVKWQFSLAGPNDLVIFLRTLHEKINHVRPILT